MKRTIFAVIVIFLLVSGFKCSKDEDATPASQVPVVTTTSATAVTQTKAVSGGNVTSAGASPITERGICWSISPSPTISDNKIVVNGKYTGSFTQMIIGLNGVTKYYVRAFATNANGTGYGNEINFTTTNTPTITIGETYQGGVITYVDGSGIHGLIAAPTDLGDYKWGCEGTSISGTSTGYGTGLNNTNSIFLQCGFTVNAARACYNLTLNGKSDWYLPSKDELDILHTNMYLNNIGNFKTTRYWSSSQYNNSRAWCQLFNLELNQLHYDKDLIPYAVRPIRSF
jgi:hypothetical protein